MKKLFILLFSLGMLNTVFAQQSRVESYGKTKNEVRQNASYSNNNSFSAKERDAQLAKINQEFDAKIKAAKKDRHLKNSEKNRQINMFEKQRDSRIKQVNAEFAKRNNTPFDNKTARSNRRS